MLHRVPAPVLAIAAIVSVQFGSAWARTFFEETGTLGAVALRLTFGSLLLLLIVRPSIRGWTRRTWIGVLGLGIALGGMNTLIYLAFEQIPIGVAVTVEFLGPLLVALVQVRRWRDVLWPVLAFGGVALLGAESSAGALSILGILFALAAALFWAGYILTSADVGRRLHGLDGLSVAMLVAAVVVVPFGAPHAIAAVTLDPMLLVVFAIVGLATSALPYSLEFEALRRMPTRVFGVLSSLGPAVAAIAGLVVVHERLSIPQLVALVLVSVASAGATLAGRRRVPPPAAGE